MRNKSEKSEKSAKSAKMATKSPQSKRKSKPKLLETFERSKSDSSSHSMIRDEEVTLVMNLTGQINADQVINLSKSILDRDDLIFSESKFNNKLNFTNLVQPTQAPEKLPPNDNLRKNETLLGGGDSDTYIEEDSIFKCQDEEDLDEPTGKMMAMVESQKDAPLDDYGGCTPRFVLHQSLHQSCSLSRI